MPSGRKSYEYFEAAAEHHSKIQQAPNGATRNEHIALAQLNATFALLAVIVETNVSGKDELRQWINHGFKPTSY